MSINIYPSIAKVKRNGVYENLPGFVQQSGDADIEAMIATRESASIAQYAHPQGSYFILNDVLYQADVDIPVSGTIAVGTNCHVAVLANDVAETENIVEYLNSSVNLDENIPLESPIDATRYINYSTGGIGSSSSATTFSHTGYIDISKFKHIKYRRVKTTSSNPSFGIAFYNSSMEYLAGERAIPSADTLGYVDRITEVPDNAVYARFTTLNDINSYGEFSVSGENELYLIYENASAIGEPNFIKKNRYYNNLWQYGNIEDEIVLKASGVTDDSPNYMLSDYIPVQEGDIIFGYGSRFCCYNSNKEFNNVSGVLNLLNTVLPNGMHYFKFPSNTAYFRICADKTLETYQFLLYLVSPFENIEPSGTKRKMYCLGDSITRGMYAEQGSSSSSGPTSHGYPYWVGLLNDYVVENLGVSGSGWANKGGNNTEESGEVDSKYVVDNNTFSDADIITLAFGVNDWKGADQNIVLGDMTSVSGDGTVIGNMKYCIETLVTKKPTAQIIILLPLNTNRQWSGMEQMTLANNWAFGYAYRNNQTLQDYRDAIKECADYYNVKVIDLEEVCPINRLNIRSVVGDGLHPTQAFYKQMGQALAPLIC